MPYLFALLSIILLIPFVLFINLGITKKGKLVIIVLSLIMSVIGIFAQMSYPLWQIVLIILLLGFLFTYILNNRFEKFLVQMNDGNEEMDLIKESTGYRNSILILEEDEEIDEHTQLGNPPEVKIGKTTFKDEEDLPLHDEIPEVVLEDESNMFDSKVEEDDQDKIDKLFQSLQDQEKEDSITNILEEEIDFSDSIEEMIKEGEESSISLKSFDEMVNDELEHPHTIIPNVKEELPAVSEKNDVFQMENFNDEIEEIESIMFSSKVEGNTETIEILDFDEDEIVPIKEFSPLPKEENSKYINEQPVKKPPVKKENYLSEIEKLLEED